MGLENDFGGLGIFFFFFFLGGGGEVCRKGNGQRSGEGE